MEFGMYRGKGFAKVKEALRRKAGKDNVEKRYKEYLQVLVSMGWSQRKPKLKNDLERDGLRDELQRKAPEVQQERAEKAVAAFEAIKA
eukprot:4804388-Karenia_brevis.AAC.1